MIVKLIKNKTFRGQKLKKGMTLAVTRAIAFDWCRKGFAVSDHDIPCEDKNKKGRIIN